MTRTHEPWLATPGHTQDEPDERLPVVTHHAIDSTNMKEPNSTSSDVK